MRREKMDKIAGDMLRCKTLKEVCEKNKISASTLYRLRKDHTFREIVTEKRIESYERALDLAHGMAELSIEALRKVILSEDCPAASRVNAVKTVLEMCASHYEDVKILARIEELEAQYGKEVVV